MLEEFTLCTKDYTKFWLEDSLGSRTSDWEGTVNQVERALSGDKVIWNSDRTKLVLNRSAKHPPLAGVLELTSKYTYGLTSRGAPLYKFTPFDRKYPPFVVGSTEKNKIQNQIGLVQYENWPTTSSMPRGALLRLFGPCGTLEAEEQGALWHATPWNTLKTIAIDEIAPPESEWNRTRVPGYTFNIDPPGCRDVDDCISIVYSPKRKAHMIWITIADVASWIPKGSELDSIASKLSQTTYKDGVAVKPMLPAELSEDRLSLLPGQKRLGISLVVEWDGETIVSTEWQKVVVDVNESYTYENVVAQLDMEWQDVMCEFTEYLSGNSETCKDPHKWVEECMILYNTEAANYLKGWGYTDAIFRRHSAPDMKRLSEYEALGADVALLAQRSAEPCWSSDPEQSHFGLDRLRYCQASSPLRRYADLWNQRLILKAIHGFSCGEEMRGSEVLKWMKEREKSLKAFERNLVLLRAVCGNDGSLTQTIEAKILEGVRITEDFLKLKLWVPAWKRVITWRTHGFIEGNKKHLVNILKGDITSVSNGDTLRLKLFANFQSASWKERILFQIVSYLITSVNTNYLEQPRRG